MGVWQRPIPVSSPGAPLGINNPYLHLFSQIDLVFIFQVVLSLIALLFAYDAIAGDWETGTLRLVLSHPRRDEEMCCLPNILRRWFVCYSPC